MTARLIVSTRATLGAIRGGVHTWTGATRAEDPDTGHSAAPIPRASVNFTDALGFFHPGSVAGVGLFKIGRLGRSLAYIRSSFHLVILSK